MLELTSTFYTVDYQTVLSRVSMRFMQNTIFTIYVHLSVRLMPVLCLNEWTYRHRFF